MLQDVVVVVGGGGGGVVVGGGGGGGLVVVGGGGLVVVGAGLEVVGAGGLVVGDPGGAVVGDPEPDRVLGLVVVEPVLFPAPELPLVVVGDPADAPVVEGPPVVEVAAVPVCALVAA